IICVEAASQDTLGLYKGDWSRSITHRSSFAINNHEFAKPSDARYCQNEIHVGAHDRQIPRDIRSLHPVPLLEGKVQHKWTGAFGISRDVQFRRKPNELGTSEGLTHQKGISTSSDKVKQINEMKRIYYLRGSKDRD
ncbi:hypothetical protein PRIPAC_78043, partial [Pristionchus pacificus]|uniref:Uncharacterized protein n=1 Tax=Pristionchus pacificus TaxID=54126 RepID=A0A2A6CNW4_PRIPA